MSNRFKEIESFVNVVELRSFTHCASLMGVQKSTVSKLITSLEERLGVRLVNRTTRSVNVTEMGVRYYNEAIKVLDALAEADASIRKEE